MLPEVSPTREDITMRIANLFGHSGGLAHTPMPPEVDPDPPPPPVSDPDPIAPNGSPDPVGDPPEVIPPER
jgi:hypothetical protein